MISRMKIIPGCVRATGHDSPIGLLGEGAQCSPRMHRCSRWSWTCHDKSAHLGGRRPLRPLAARFSAGISPVSQHEPWGVQIGGVHTPTDYHDCDRRLEEISVDHHERVGEFKRRHGGLIDSASRNERVESGCGGWSEIYAADGYVLRVEWSRSEMRGAMRVFEFRPPQSG